MSYGKGNWMRHCPKCNAECHYSSKAHMDECEKRNRICKSCASKLITGPGRKKGKYGKYKKSKYPEMDVYKRNCPLCNKEIIYKDRVNWMVAHRKNRACSTYCPSRIHPKEYFTEYQKYKYDVWYYTNKQPLHLLKNFENRGHQNQKNTYAIDHIVSIKTGFQLKISPKLVGSFENLQMLKHGDNSRKKHYVTNKSKKILEIWNINLLDLYLGHAPKNAFNKKNIILGEE